MTIPIIIVKLRRPSQPVKDDAVVDSSFSLGTRDFSEFRDTAASSVEFLVSLSKLLLGKLTALPTNFTIICASNDIL